MKNARPPKNEKSSAPKQGDVKPSSSFSGTDNPRHLRVIQALLTRSRTREQIDTAAGCSNGRELIAELRRRGLSIPCTRTKKQDRDHSACWPGGYNFTQTDRRKLTAWKRKLGKDGNL